MMTDLIFGADISTLEDTENQGGKFYHDKKEVALDQFLKDNGISSIRLRIWNNPYSADGTEYGGGTCDIEKILRTAKRIKTLGMSFMLDFHYSDFWCDPARQGIPKAWKNKTVDEMCEAIYSFTKETVTRFINEGAAPEYIQVGNEITNGMLWDMGKLDRSNPEALSKSFDILALFSSNSESLLYSTHS
ncbi:MAG: glycosyl hydrolase 53 family protein [Oscillospiraceae bacterium]|nr:glycosyl hydrolase 53 family protein [Oscillospiraceae bacterium]